MYVHTNSSQVLQEKTGALANTMKFYASNKLKVTLKNRFQTQLHFHS